MPNLEKSSKIIFFLTFFLIFSSTTVIAGDDYLAHHAKDLLGYYLDNPVNQFLQNNLLLLFFYGLLFLLLLWVLRKNILLLILIVIGSTTWSLTMIKSGLLYDYGLGFWGPNGHDGIWHLTLINQLKNFSLENPVFSGIKLANYHLGFDLLAALMSKIFLISPVRLYFQILPPLTAVAIGYLVHHFVFKWTKNSKSAWWATFFVYLGGSWGWLLGKGESTFWANQAISTLINPPYALSLILLLAGLVKLLDYFEKPDKKNLLICSVLLGTLIQVKVYAGVLVLGSLVLLCVFKKGLRRLCLSSFIVSAIVFLPFNLKGASLLVFSPLWFSRSMIAYPDRVGWIKLASATSTFALSKNWFKLFLAESLALVIFIFGNLGSRVIGFLECLRQKNIKKVSSMGIFIFAFLFFSLVIPLLFIQKGNPWNTIQFFYYFQFMMAILTGISLGRLNLMLFRNKVIVSVIFLVTLPTSFLTLKSVYLPSRPPARISIEELEALEFLGKQPDGVVLSFPFDQHWREIFSEPRPLYAYETTGYVSAFSGKASFLADEMNLEISGYPWRERREASISFFKTDNTDFANSLIRENKIKYLYLVKGQSLNLDPKDLNAEKIFENGEVVIYKVK